MEVNFPPSTDYSGFFLIGFRKTAGNVTERTGTVVLKRTYDIDPVTGSLTPAAPLPIFLQDQPDNLVENSGFQLAEEGTPVAWTPETATIAHALGQGVTAEAGDHALQITGPPNSRIIQTLTFDEPLGGRQFFFSLSARSLLATARIEKVQLEVEGSAPICVIDRNLGAAFTRFAAGGMWPANVQATEMRVVLRAATTAGRTILYDQIQVEERSHETKWDPKTVLRYEHDLAPFKPQGDVIVLGFTDTNGVSRVQVNQAVWFEEEITRPGGRRLKAMFGWEPRVQSPREDEAGTFPDSADAYPLSDPLPANFGNLFYNGYRREARRLPGAPHLPSNARIHIERVSGADYRFTLPGETVSARFFYHRTTDPDERRHWRSTPVTMNLDTLVIEPEEHRCYVVWRGVWPFNTHPDDAYRRLVVTAPA